EKDFQRILAGLLRMDDRFGILTEAEPADRQRLDILITSSDRRTAIVEMKFYEPREIPAYRQQLLAYAASLDSSRGPITESHLVLLDRRPLIDWTQPERRELKDGIHLWRVHVNRQPASMSK
ncbi:MAG TPA: hypothetical protein VIW92_00255, partial [Thermoanaerobaculia bacterium]